MGVSDWRYGEEWGCSGSWKVKRIVSHVRKEKKKECIIGCKFVQVDSHYSSDAAQDSGTSECNSLLHAEIILPSHQSWSLQGYS
jgi:hypothetical protein